MAVYLISYDINEKDAFEYDELWATLKNMGARRILYSEWVVTGNTGQSGTIYNKVKADTQGKDRLLVQELMMSAHWDKLLITDDEFRAIMNHART